MVSLDLWTFKRKHITIEKYHAKQEASGFNPRALRNAEGKENSVADNSASMNSWPEHQTAEFYWALKPEK